MAHPVCELRSPRWVLLHHQVQAAAAAVGPVAPKLFFVEEFFLPRFRCHFVVKSSVSKRRWERPAVLGTGFWRPGAGRSTALHPRPGIQAVNGAALGISALCLVFWRFALAQEFGGGFHLQLALHRPCSRFLPLLIAVTPVSRAGPRIQSPTGIQTSR